VAKKCILSGMKTTFNEFFDWLTEEAARQHLKKGAWMITSGLHPQRWAEFARAAKILPIDPGKRVRDITTYYFLKLIGGLKLTPEQASVRSGIRFSPEQRRALKFHEWVQTEQEFLMALMDEPEKLRICKAVCELPKK
jgi:hypothetical protein